MNFKDRVEKRYKILSGQMKNLTIDIDEYLGENEDDADDVHKLAKNKDEFLKSPTIKNICKRINPNLTPSLLYNYFDESECE